MQKYTKGVLVGRFYKKTRSRNEALDLKVYNMAALKILNPNLEALGVKMQKKIEKAKARPILDSTAQIAERLEQTLTPAPLVAARPVRMSQPMRHPRGFVQGWR